MSLAVQNYNYKVFNINGNSQNQKKKKYIKKNKRNETHTFLLINLLLWNNAKKKKVHDHSGNATLNCISSQLKKLTKNTL